MDPIQKYDIICQRCSKQITKFYSTSFSIGIYMIPKVARQHIYNIYGLVRFADEIVDSFHFLKQDKILKDFVHDTYSAINKKYSSNPVLHSFQITYNLCDITPDLLDPFFESMRMDIDKKNYTEKSYKKYILGSAEVVGLMCLKVFSYFSNGENSYYELKKYAQSLGSSFQKINFLRDIHHDYEELGRLYFPDIDYKHFTLKDKEKIFFNIKTDLDNAYKGIMKLTPRYRKSILLIYNYYNALFKKIITDKHNKFLVQRIRISNFNKYISLFKIIVFKN